MIHLFQRRQRRERSPASLAVSIVIHVALVFALGSIVWRYPLGQLMGITKREYTPERLLYIAIPSGPTENSGPRSSQEAGGPPAALQAPVAVPQTLPPVPPPDSSQARAAGGTGTGNAAAGSGAATGIVPRQPDSRIALLTGPVARVPRTAAETVDSIVSLAIGIYNDSIAIANGQRKPGDWTFKGKNGEKWGWDNGGIRLGKFTIPNALLALLPLNTAGGGSPIETRSMAYIRRDVFENGQRAISEDEFRDAVKRIRERKDRERRERLLASELQ